MTQQGRMRYLLITCSSSAAWGWALLSRVGAFGGGGDSSTRTCMCDVRPGHRPVTTIAPERPPLPPSDITSVSWLLEGPATSWTAAAAGCWPLHTVRWVPLALLDPPTPSHPHRPTTTSPDHAPCPALPYLALP